MGAVKWGKGKFGAALAFDGGNVTIPHHDSMNLIQFTITAWIKVPKIVNPYLMIAGKEAWPDRNYSMWIRPGVMTFGFTTPGAAQDIQVGSKEVTDDKWHFVVGTYDKKVLTPYVEGEKLGTRAAGPKPADQQGTFYDRSSTSERRGTTQGNDRRSCRLRHSSR